MKDLVHITKEVHVLRFTWGAFQSRDSRVRPHPDCCRWTEPKKGPQEWLRHWRISPVRKTETAETDTPGEGLEEILCMNIWRESAKMEPGSSHQCPVMHQRQRGRTETQEAPPEHQETLPPQGQQHQHRGTRETGASPLSEVLQSQLDTILGLRKPWLSLCIGCEHLQSSLPTSTILWRKG